MSNQVLPPLRLFVAIELPQPWLDVLAETQKRMKTAIEADKGLAGVRVRWLRPEGIHLTLKFIGEVGPDRLGPIVDQLSRAVPAVPEITIALDRIGTFEDRRAPRVIWAGLRDEPSLSLLRLAESIETWLAAAGVPRERRAYRGHLTLARLPEGLTAAQRKRAVEVTSGVTVSDVAPFQVDGVSLMQSFLGPGGARYERLGRWPE